MNANNPFEKFAKEAKRISFPPAAKSALRERVLNYAAEHPVRKETDPRQYFHQRSLKEIIINKFKFIFNPVPILALLLILVTGTGVALAAENSLPGDLLHPVKINVNETVRSVLAFSPEAKANVEVEKADRRLEEIEKLAAKGKLDSRKVEKAEIKFKAHLDNASRIVDAIKENKGEEETANLRSVIETVLLLHDGILAGIKTEEGEVELKFKSLRQGVRNEAKEAIEERIKNERKITEVEDSQLKSAAEGKLKAAENKIAEVKNFLEQKKDKIAAEVMAESRNLLKSAEDAILDGKSKMAEDKNGEAFMLFQKAIRLAQFGQRLAAVSSAIKDTDILKAPFDLKEKIKFPEREIEIEIEMEQDGLEIEIKDEEKDRQNRNRDINDEEARDGERIRFRAELAGDVIGAVIPSGRADFEKRGDRIIFSAEVEDVNLPEGTELKITVGEKTIGVIKAEGAGREQDFNLDSRQGEQVPEIKSGDIVKILSPQGQAVLTGTFNVKD